MIVKLVLLLVLSFAPAFGDNWRSMERFFTNNIEEKDVLEEKDLDFCKKFASVLISGLKAAIPKYNKLVDEECANEKSFDAYCSDDYSSASEKLSGLIGWLSYDLAMVKKKLPDKYHGVISAIHDASRKDLCDACDNALAVLSQ
jgi:hypothetical protein